MSARLSAKLSHFLKKTNFGKFEVSAELLERTQAQKWHLYHCSMIADKHSNVKGVHESAEHEHMLIGAVRCATSVC